MRRAPLGASPTEVATGATIAGPARDRFRGGCAGYFQDPNGHLREVARNPAWDVEE